MKVLVIDDEHNKAADIKATLEEANVGPIEITHKSNGVEGRRALRKSFFDLLILDLNLPDNYGSVVYPEGGIEFIRLLLEDLKATIPSEIIIVTSKEDLLSTKQNELRALGISYAQYSPNASAWKAQLIGKAKLIEARKAREVCGGKQIDIAIITALPDPELEAVLKLPYQWTIEEVRNDPTNYYRGIIKNESASLNVVCASALRKGMSAAAALSTKMAMIFNPRFVVMLGICAGLKSKTTMGDVIVADPTWDWGSGKTTEMKGSPTFLISPHQVALTSSIAQVAMALGSNQSVLSTIRTGWDKDFPQGTLKVHVGPMASGASVLARQGAVDEIVSQNRDVLGIEMEAYAVMAACEYFSTNKPIAIAIKSVCDHGDIEKGGEWQKYAAYTSAAFAHILFNSKIFLENEN